MTILLVSSNRMRLEATSFAVILIFIPFTAHGMIYRISGSEFYFWLSGPKQFSGLSRNGPLAIAALFCTSFANAEVAFQLQSSRHPCELFTWSTTNLTLTHPTPLFPPREPWAPTSGPKTPVANLPSTKDHLLTHPQFRHTYIPHLHLFHVGCLVFSHGLLFVTQILKETIDSNYS